MGFGIVINLHFPDEVIEGHRDYIAIVSAHYMWSCVSGNHLTDKTVIKWEVCKTQYHMICSHGSFRVAFCILLTLMLRLDWAVLQNES